jgi:hypothetical protein
VSGFFLAVQAGAWATGLPPAPHHDNQRCTAGGQARAAIALWAGAAASPEGADTLRDVVSEGVVGIGSTITFPEWNGPPMWGVEYAVADAEAALAMLELPTDAVRTAVALEWDRWIDPATTTSTLTSALGIEQATTATASAGADCP